MTEGVRITDVHGIFIGNSTTHIPDNTAENKQIGGLFCQQI